MSSKHLYLSGPPRSGTTMLELIASAHSAVTITPETHFIQKVLRKKYLAPDRLSPDKTDSIIQFMQADKKLNSWPGFDLDKFMGQTEPAAFTLAGLLDALFRSYAVVNNSGTIYLGNKKGLYADGFGPYIKRLHPDARFIFIVRDPRDVTRSIMKNLEAKELKNAAFTCCRREYYISRMQKEYPGDVLVIHYEDLVLDPEKTCRYITSFLGLEFEIGMLSFYEKNIDGSRLLGLTRDIHSNTRGPFNPDLIGQWEKDSSFNPRELKRIELINYCYMEKYSYKVKSELTPMQIWAARLLSGFKVRLHHLKRIIEFIR